VKLRLFDWSASPYCLKVRAILEYKGLAYAREPVLGGSFAELLRRGTVRKVPALDVDGRLVEDSTEIAHELERLAPEPSIVPTDPRQRALCHALEDWADEALYWPGLWFQWIDVEGAPLVVKTFHKFPMGRVILPFYKRRVRAQLVGQGTGRKSAERIGADLERSLDAVEALVSPGPFLLGDVPYLCDFAMLGQIVYLTRPPRTAPMITARPAISAWLERMKVLRAAPS